MGRGGSSKSPCPDTWAQAAGVAGAPTQGAKGRSFSASGLGPSGMVVASAAASAQAARGVG
ncbi:hypothetical protein [Geothrix edaphica]|uniref:hypothetical protein n=1 Tax=Geothrix edaphica TaxID=2927976 RepID=UPI0025535507|nr:hypothetical protein [Geothrix edaphica]